jgi:hypothetical protein
LRLLISGTTLAIGQDKLEAMNALRGTLTSYQGLVMNKLAALFAISLAAACAGGDPAMDMDDPIIDDPGVDDPTVDTTPPTIQSISPADGASGIHRDATVTIAFSEAMDQLSVQNSLDAADLGAVSFEWNAEGTTMRIVPAVALEYAEGTGTDPSVTPGIIYGVVLGTGATDAAGNAVTVGIQSNFTTLKRITHTLVRDNEQTGAGTPSGVTTDDNDFLTVGDDDAGGLANGYRGYITMDMSPLPESALEVESATLRGHQMFVSGDPYEALGNGNGLIIDHGIFELGANGNENSAFNLDPLSTVGELAQADDLALSIDVSSQVNDDLQNRVARLDRSQYRLRFDGFSNLDNVEDAAFIGRNELAIEVVYIAP